SHGAAHRGRDATPRRRRAGNAARPRLRSSPGRPGRGRGRGAPPAPPTMDLASRGMYRISCTEPRPVTERTRHMARGGVRRPMLAHQLRGYRWTQVVAASRTQPPSRIAAAVALAVVNYLVLTGYDTLAARFVGKTLPYRRTAFASFVSYVIAHNVGASFIGG